MEGVYLRKKAEDLLSMLACFIPLQEFQVAKYHPVPFVGGPHELVTTKMVFRMILVLCGRDFGRASVLQLFHL